MLTDLLWMLFMAPLATAFAAGLAGLAWRLLESLARLDRHPVLMPPRPSPRHGRDMTPMPGDRDWKKTTLMDTGHYAPSCEIGDVLAAQDAARIRFRQRLPGEARRFWHASGDVRASTPQRRLSHLPRSIN